MGKYFGFDYAASKRAVEGKWRQVGGSNTLYNAGLDPNQEGGRWKQRGGVSTQ